MNWEQAWLNLKADIKQRFEQQRLYEIYEVLEEDRVAAGNKADALETVYNMMLYSEDHEGELVGFDG